MPKTHYYKRTKVYIYICPICSKKIQFHNFEVFDMCNWNNENNPCKKYINEKKYILDKNFDIINKEKEISAIRFENDETQCKLLVDNCVVGIAKIYPEIEIKIENLNFYEIFNNFLKESQEQKFKNLVTEMEKDISFM